MRRSIRTQRQALLHYFVLGCLVLIATPTQGHEQGPASITVRTIAPTGMPLTFESISVTSDGDQGNRGLLKYRLRSSAVEDLTSVGVGYVVFRADKSVRAGGFKVERLTVPANSWAEEWTLLDTELLSGDCIVVTLNEAASATTNWKADRMAIVETAKALATSGVLSLPTARATTLSR